MNEMNSHESTENTTEETLNTPNITDTPETTELPQEPENKETAVAAAAKRGYHNRTARLLNGVFVVLLVFMVIFLLLQMYLNVASYMQQGASIGLALLYILASSSTSFLLCALPFIFKFFAEVVELLDRNNK